MTTAEMVTPGEAFGLLSSMYLCKPSREALENWKRALAEDTSIFLADLKKAISGIDLNSEEEVENLLSEHTRLFIGPYKLPCPPWESVYTSPKRLMMQDAADQVRALYEGAGLTINTAEVMPDHIGAELNFIALLFQRMNSNADGKDVYPGITEKLLDEHLLKWIPDFTKDMEEAAETSFYKEVARATRKVIDFVGR
ncbi:MAG: molecular chaperone TorD family protein [Nitrospiraceae bacterium]|nr:molecular chaperone TorD family protein [Nitrospiraceae bacterium]